MTNRWSRWCAGSGVMLFLLWAPMALIVPRLPDLGSPTRIEHFYRTEHDPLSVVILLVSLGFLFFLGFLGALMDRLRHTQGLDPLTWTAFASALMFMTALAIAIGLVAACALLSATSTPEVIGAFHTAAFVLAAPVAPAGVAFFLAIAALSFNAGAFPRWLGWTSLLAALANVGALGGILSLTGPLNSGNGALAGIAVPVFAWALWILLASIWMLRSLQPTVTALDTEAINLM